MQNNNKRAFEIINSKTKIYLIIIAILLIVICLYETAFVMPAVILFGLICFYAIWTNNKRKAEISEHIQELTITVDSAAKNTLINSPFPLIIMENDGNVIWKSSKFTTEFANIDINTYIDDISLDIKDAIKKDNEKDSKKEITKQVRIGEKDYKVIAKYVKYNKNRNKEKKSKKEYMIILYFIDDSENIKKQKENSLTGERLDYYY